MVDTTKEGKCNNNKAVAAPSLHPLKRATKRSLKTRVPLIPYKKVKSSVPRSRCTSIWPVAAHQQELEYVRQHCNEQNICIFFQYILERYKIYLRRKRGYPKPWIDDGILRVSRFCNVFRDHD